MPTVEAWRPQWNVHTTATPIEPGARIAVVSYADSDSLMGAELTQQKQLEQLAAGFLYRRGFEPGAAPADYQLRIRFRGDDYTRALDMDLRDARGNVPWSGQSAWVPVQRDAQVETRFAMQLLFGTLPHTTGRLPFVETIREDRIEQDYDAYINGVWFVSPALPHRIRFPRFSRLGMSGPYGRASRGLPNAIESPRYLDAYQDLVQTAEDALPVGTLDWNDPMSPRLWSKVQLGGRYRSGPDDDEIAVIVTLTGGLQGYTVESCRVVDSGEYLTFRATLVRWRQALADHYDLFVRN